MSLPLRRLLIGSKGRLGQGHLPQLNIVSFLSPASPFLTWPYFTSAELIDCTYKPFLADARSIVLIVRNIFPYMLSGFASMQDRNGYTY